MEKEKIAREGNESTAGTLETMMSNGIGKPFYYWDKAHMGGTELLVHGVSLLRCDFQSFLAFGELRQKQQEKMTVTTDPRRKLTPATMPRAALRNCSRC